MKNKIDEWELIVTPRFVNKNPKYKEEKCINCVNGYTRDTQCFGWGSPSEKCLYCYGKGLVTLKVYENPPEIEQAFLDALKKFMNEYPWEN
jgi:hypothetical protein